MIDTDKHQTALATYNHEGGEYSIEFPATSWADAERRIARMRQSLKLTGWPAYSVPAVPGSGIFVRLATWWLNRKGQRQ